MEHEALTICVAMFYIVVLVKHIVFYYRKLLEITKLITNKIILMRYKIQVTATRRLQESKCEVHEA